MPPTQLLDDVRTLKLQARSDEEIKRQLQPNYSAADIVQALMLLRNVQPAAPSAAATAAAPPSPVSRTKKRKILLGILLAALVLVLVGTRLVSSGLAMRFIQPTTMQAFSKVSAMYGGEHSYAVSSSNDCLSRGPSGLFEFTGTTDCYRITAKAYYPQMKRSDSPQDDLTMVEYRTSSGYQNIDTAIYGTSAPTGPNQRPGMERVLGLRDTDHVALAGIDLAFTNPAYNNLLHQWHWTTYNDGFLKVGPNSDHLRSTVDTKVLANTKLASTAPTTKEALDSGRAPLVVYVMVRYCHSPKIPGLDHSCILPG